MLSSYIWIGYSVVVALLIYNAVRAWGYANSNDIPKVIFHCAFAMLYGLTLIFMIAK